MIVRLHDDLAWDNPDPRHAVVIHAGERVASFECLMPDEPRVVARLEFLDGHRSIDIGVQPDTIMHLLRRLARRANKNADAWQRALRRQLLDSAAGWGLDPSVEPDDSLGAVIAVLGFPLIEMARARGVTPPPFIPRWAEAVLVSGEPRAAAREVFGRRASRRVARALAASLIGSDEPRAERPMVLIPLAFAMALPSEASSDFVANVLEGEVAPHAAQHWPSVDELETIRRGFRLLGPQLSTRLALEAMQRLDGPSTLASVMVHVPPLLASHDRPCPQHLGALEAMVEELVNEPVEMARRAAAPERVAAVAPGDEFRYPDAVLHIHGAASGEYSLWLPRSSNELRAWGAELSNCMADYCEYVANNRSVILGLRRRRRLVAGVELSRDLRRVRQFVRDGNQRPWLAQRDAVRDIFGRLGVAGS